MNWSKAKTILIVALIFTNLFLLSNYLHNEGKIKKQIESATESAIEYMEKTGVDIKCPVPKGVAKLNVLSVSFLEGDKGGSVYETEVDNIPLEIVGLSDSSYIDYIEKTNVRIESLPAYTALLKSLGSVTNEINDIKLIYLVDRAAYTGQGGKDTALPYWKITSGDNSYYYSAFAE